MKKMILSLLIGLSAPLASEASHCKFSFNGSGELFLSAGSPHSLEVEVQRSQDNLRVLLQICEEVYAATHCRAYTLEKDEWQKQEGDPKSFYVNMGRERAELTLGALPSWIAQFATRNYSKDQSGLYYSAGACESNRARIAIEVAERAHDVIEDGEEEEAARQRREQLEKYREVDWGPKY